MLVRAVTAAGLPKGYRPALKLWRPESSLWCGDYTLLSERRENWLATTCHVRIVNLVRKLYISQENQAFSPLEKYPSRYLFGEEAGGIYLITSASIGGG